MYTVEGTIYNGCNPYRVGTEFVAAQRIQRCKTKSEAEQVAAQFTAEGFVDVSISESASELS